MIGLTTVISNSQAFSQNVQDSFIPDVLYDELHIREPDTTTLIQHETAHTLLRTFITTVYEAAQPSKIAQSGWHYKREVTTNFTVPLYLIFDEFGASVTNDSTNTQRFIFVNNELYYADGDEDEYVCISQDVIDDSSNGTQPVICAVSIGTEPSEEQQQSITSFKLKRRNLEARSLNPLQRRVTTTFIQPTITFTVTSSSTTSTSSTSTSSTTPSSTTSSTTSSSTVDTSSITTMTTSTTATSSDTTTDPVTASYEGRFVLSSDNSLDWINTNFPISGHVVRFCIQHDTLKFYAFYTDPSETGFDDCDEVTLVVSKSTSSSSTSISMTSTTSTTSSTSTTATADEPF